MYCKVTPTCGPAGCIAISLACATSQLLGPICPLLGHTIFILGGTINDTDVPSGVRMSLSYTLRYFQLTPPWVEVSLHSSLIGRY